MTGDQITTHLTPGDMLAGAPLRPGDAQEIRASGQRVRGRYEEGRPGQALIHLSFDPAGPLETVLSIDRAGLPHRATRRRRTRCGARRARSPYCARCGGPPHQHYGAPKASVRGRCGRLQS